MWKSASGKGSCQLSADYTCTHPTGASLHTTASSWGRGEFLVVILFPLDKTCGLLAATFPFPQTTVIHSVNAVWRSEPGSNESEITNREGGGTLKRACVCAPFCHCAFLPPRLKD